MATPRADANSLVQELRSAADGLRLKPWGFDGRDSVEFDRRLKALDARTKVQLLHVAVEAMPGFREAGDELSGALLYQAASALYRDKLPLTEADLIDLLLAARHGCGHGCDTRAPFDVALAHMRRGGYSEALGTAIQEFIANLPPAHAIKVKELHRAADLLSVLSDPGPPNSRVKLRPWIDSVAEQLTRLDGAELDLWRRLVLAMSVAERHVMPKTWERVAVPFVTDIGRDVVIIRMQQWWPPAGAEVSLKRSGAQLLKHCIWLLGLVRGAESDELVGALATMTWYPSPAPMAVLKPASAYLEEADSPGAAAARARIDALIATAD